MPQKKAEVARKQTLIKLRKLVVAARARWEKQVKENSETQRSIRGREKRSKTRVLYIARYGKWFDGMEKELLALQAKIAKAGYVGSTKPRSLWLPTVIENPLKITLRIYPAISNRKVTLTQAKDFARKAKCATELSQNDSYAIKSITGNAHTLRVKYQHAKISRFVFTEWVLCICRDKSSLPKLKKSRLNSGDIDYEFNNAICTHEKRALVVRPNNLSRKVEAQGVGDINEDEDEGWHD